MTLIKSLKMSQSLYFIEDESFNDVERNQTGFKARILLIK